MDSGEKNPEVRPKNNFKKNYAPFLLKAIFKMPNFLRNCHLIAEDLYKLLNKLNY